MISALFVETDGIYFNDPRINPFDVKRDAFSFSGPGPVIAHPPCQRWGRYWSGGPMLAKTERALKLGDDRGAFAFALWAVRTFGGVLEHPEASHAWKWFGLARPNYSGGWVKADDYGGMTCCVAQGHYGHRAQKLTWLYGVNIDFKELIWGRCEGKLRLEEGPRSKEAAKAMRARSDFKPKERISDFERNATPVEFKELLISMLRKAPDNV